MLEALRDPAWQFVGVVLALLGIILTFWIYWLQRQTKELAFGLVSSRRLLAVADEVSSRVTVQLDGHTVRDLHLLVYGLINSGHRAITANDFERPFSISFADGKIVSAQISLQHPQNINAELSVSDHNVQLVPLLLNPGDHILIQVLLSAPKPFAIPDGRVFEISSYAPINTQSKLPPLHQSGLFFVAVLGALIATGTYFLAPDREAFYVFSGFTVFALTFGFITRIIDNTGPWARRRVRET